MSQKGSSIVSSDNPELKYKKALMEIQKIHNANKVLKSQSEEMKAQYEHQINQMSISLQQLQKENEDIKNDKIQLEKFLEELQVSNSELRKEYNNLQREVSYLNEVLTEQNTELKKVNAFKDQKGLTALINSYEDREISYRKDLARQEDLIKTLKSSCETLENDLAEERRQRYKLEDLNNSLRMEISKYRELNNSLLSKNEAIVTGLLNRTSQGREKYRQAETILSEIGRQLDFVKHSRVQQQTLQRNTVSLDNYEGLLQEKNKIEGELHRLREKLQEYEHKSREHFEVEEKMKRASLRAEQLQEQCNMLKSKLVVVETKELMEQSEDVELKEFQERVIANIGQNDPLPAIKNSSDSSHFQLMKAYVVQLKDKLTKALIDKKEYEKKYRSLKEKIGEKAEKALGLQEQNKLLRGKLEGFERLSQRLQFELQRNIEDHEEEINKMKQMTNGILNKKAEETKAANAFLRAQLDLELDKFQRVQKGLRQEVETLRLELSTEKIKGGDLHDKLKQTSEFLAIFKSKYEETQKQLQEAQEINAESSENCLKFQQLYREERAKNESLLNQKQALTNQIAQASEQKERRFHFQNDFEEKEANYEAQIRRLKLDITQAKAQIQQLQTNFKAATKELQEKSRLLSLQSAKSDNSYHTSLQQSYQKERERNRQLETQLTTIKLRIERTGSQYQKSSSLEDALSKKTDELNDLKRKAIGYEKQIGLLEAEIKDLKSDYESLKRENTGLKTKILENGQQIRKLYESKELQSKRTIQRLTEDQASTTSQLREERRTNARLQSDLQNIKGEFRRYEQMIEQAKRKEMSVSQELNTLQNNYESAYSENQRLKSQLKYKNSIQESLNAEINGTQDRIFKLNQENTELRLKMQSTDNDYSELRRDVGGLKVYLNEIQDFSNTRSANGGWQEQRDKENLANFVQRLKKIIRTTELAQTNVTTDYRSGSFGNPYSSTNPLPDYLKPYMEQTFNNGQKYPQNSEESSPFVLNDRNFEAYGEGYDNFVSQRSEKYIG